MRLNSKGQVTIPAWLRHKHGLREGDEVEVVDSDGELRIVPAGAGESRGQRVVARMRGRADTTLTTDELMALLSGG
ncbi:MAG TPA: AbrB/MazE/SpoVT family DNA-binding domain-containing protein [Nocardioidaceae bacterium]|nr:AbrB/MazE/SpoVT family DNA-binding domain-containing protein [Nocardioidaceae bacterium]